MSRPFDGKANPERRKAAESKRVIEEQGVRYPVRRFIKTVPTYAVRMPFPFEVDTLEGLHTGQEGDYLAIGAHGEMYPVAASVMEDTYREDDIAGVPE